MRYRVWPYRQGSHSAKALATALGGLLLKRQASRFRPGPRDVIINWGDTDPPAFVTVNREGIRNASNKLIFFRRMRDAGFADIIPAFWESRDAIPPKSFPVVCRTVLSGHSGAGIVIAENANELVEAPLYTQYVKKSEEYRIHVGKVGEEFRVIRVQRKARRHDTPDAQVNWRVRNHANGFVYVRHEGEPRPGTFRAAFNALSASGLDFGAVDLIYNEKSEKSYVLEINTAPGLEGTSVTDYATFFQESNS